MFRKRSWHLFLLCWYYYWYLLNFVFVFNYPKYCQNLIKTHAVTTKCADAENQTSPFLNDVIFTLVTVARKAIRDTSFRKTRNFRFKNGKQTNLQGKSKSARHRALHKITLHQSRSTASNPRQNHWIQWSRPETNIGFWHWTKCWSEVSF